MAGTKNDRIIAFIPVRGGSKSIPQKNIKLMCGKPLVCWSLEAASHCRHIDRIYVSTEAPEIKEVIYGLHNPKVSVVNRSLLTATDTASTEAAMLEFARDNDTFEIVVLMQATSPLTTAADLEQAIKMYLDAGADSLVSLTRQKRFVWQARDGSGAMQVEPWNYDPVNRPRRQDFPGFLVENGAFYITKRQSLLDTECRLSGKIIGYEMNEKTYVEIDEPSDWEIVSTFLRRSEDFKKLNQVKLFVTDVDGVLTDAGMYYSETGDELKKFNTRDGMGLRLLRERGIRSAIITSETTRIVARRAAKLKIDFLVQGVANKVEALQPILTQLGLSYDEVLFIGDDLNDIPLLEKVGFAATVADGHPQVKNVVQYICSARGGAGAVRELCDLILANMN